MLQHTATHCNTLQRTSHVIYYIRHTHCSCCNTLQHTATHCNTRHTSYTILGTHIARILGCVLQRVAACCSVLQCVAVCCSVLQCVAVCCSVLQCASVCCSALQCVAVCCGVLQYGTVWCSVVQCGVVCCYGVATISRLLKIIGLFCRI